MNDIPIPKTIAVCPYCDGQLFLIVEAWTDDTGIPTESGIHLDCEGEKDSDPDHMETPYLHSHWLPIYRRVYTRFARYCRVRDGVLCPPPPTPWLWSPPPTRGQ